MTLQDIQDKIVLYVTTAAGVIGVLWRTRFSFNLARKIQRAELAEMENELRRLRSRLQAQLDELGIKVAGLSDDELDAVIKNAIKRGVPEITVIPPDWSNGHIIRVKELDDNFSAIMYGCTECKERFGLELIEDMRAGRVMMGRCRKAPVL